MLRISQCDKDLIFISLSCREVVASPPLLNLPDGVKWKDFKVSEEEEQAFRKKFNPHDFNLN